MKKRLLIVTLVLAFASSHAKLLELAPVVAFGGCYNTIHESVSIGETDIATKNQFKTSYAFGAAAQCFLSSHWALGISMLYSREGYSHQFNSNVDFENFDYSQKAAANYFRIPLQMSYYFRSNDKKWRPYVSAGMSMGLLLHQNTDVTANNFFTQQYMETSGLGFPKYQSFDVGMQFGAGCSYKVNKKSKLFAELKYYRGVLDPFVGNYVPDMRNENVRIQLGYSFTLI